MIFAAALVTLGVAIEVPEGWLANPPGIRAGMR